MYPSVHCTPGSLGQYQIARVRGLILDNVPSHRASGHGQRRRQIELPRPAASGEISVLSADHNLLGTRRNSRPRIDARPTTRLDHVCAGFLENLDVAFALRILARFLGPELDPEIDIFRNSLTLLQRIGEYRRVHIHVFVLPRRTSSTISDFNRHASVDFADVLAVARIPR